jgi:hypothetical protein
MVSKGRLLIVCFVAGALLVSVSAAPVAGQEKGAHAKIPVEVLMTESFYRALKNEGGKTYTTSKSEDYLRRIAVSARFMVETNLEVIKQQARIIELLEDLRDKPAR